MTPDDLNLMLGVAAIVSASFTALAAMSVGMTVLQNRRALEATLFGRLFSDIRRLEETLGSTRSDEERRRWDSVFFNTLEFLAMLINAGYLRDRRFIGFFEPAIITWYERLFVSLSPQETLMNPQAYPELKALYRRTKPSRPVAPRGPLTFAFGPLVVVLERKCRADP